MFDDSACSKLRLRSPTVQIKELFWCMGNVDSCCTTEMPSRRKQVEAAEEYESPDGVSSVSSGERVHTDRCGGI